MVSIYDFIYSNAAVPLHLSWLQKSGSLRVKSYYRSETQYYRQRHNSIQSPLTSVTHSHRVEPVSSPHIHTSIHEASHKNEWAIVNATHINSILFLCVHTSAPTAVFQPTHIPHTAAHEKSLKHFKGLIISSRKLPLMATCWRTRVAHQRESWFPLQSH